MANMRMEINLETMLDIALGGPEIGPLNLQVLHGIMREVFQRMELSDQNIVIEKESSDFCNSFNFIKSKMDEKNKRPRTAGGGFPKLRSNVSVIVAEYARTPIGEEFVDYNATLPTSDMEDRLRYVESELKNVKDFPSIDELRSWAKEKANPDTVVTDLWHFVSLNHRVNALEEGIQKLTKLVDKLIPEMKSLGEEQSLMHGKVDDLYSQFKGLSDRLTYIDSKVDSNIDIINKKIEDKIQNVITLIERIERKLVDYPKFKDLSKLVTIDMFNEVEERARDTIKDLRAQLSTKLNFSILEELVSKDDFKGLVNTLNSINAKLDEYAKIDQLDNYVTNNVYNEAQEITDNMARKVEVMNATLSGKADLSSIDDLAIKEDVNKLSERVESLSKVAEQQTDIYNKLHIVDEQLKKKADNDDVVDVLRKEDMKKTFTKIQNHQCAINEIQNWQKSFDTDEKPILNSKVNDLIGEASAIKESLSTLRDEYTKDADIIGLQTTVQQITDQFNEHDTTCKSNISGILNNIDLKLDKTEIKPLKEYLESCYDALAQQYQDSLNEQCNHSVHQPRPPKSQGMPHISQSSINISTKGMEDSSCNHDGFIHHKSDAAAIRTQMKFNCLSCSQPLVTSLNNQFQTVRGKALNAYELDHLRLLQKMLKPDVVDIDSRPCGGKHTSSMPYKKTNRNSAKSLPPRAFTNHDGVLIDGEVDIEGLDGKLYRGLISRKDFICYNRCKSANAEIRTVSPMHGSGKDRPISGKSVDFRASYGRVTAS